MRGLIVILACLIVSTAFLAPGTGALPLHASDDDDSPGLRENLLPAQQGDAKAQVFVAYLYETGQGVKQNYAKAAEWYGKAARQGNPEAQTQLGNMYRLGRGVPQSYVLAHMWLDLASRQGSKQASELITSVNKKMTRKQLAEASRLAKNWKPEN